jgi:hypothetical protein
MKRLFGRFNADKKQGDRWVDRIMPKWPFNFQTGRGKRIPVSMSLVGDGITEEPRVTHAATNDHIEAVEKRFHGPPTPLEEAMRDKK